MKLQFRQIEPFLKQPDKTARAILVYGPDSGLVQERAAQLGRFFVPDLNDPFNVSHLEGSVIAADTARLADEASAQSLMGGMRLVRITGAGNEVALPLKDWLKNNPNPDSVIVIEAGNLGPRDALRKICEDALNAAALPCYVEDERSIATLIRDSLREAGLTIAADASAWLATSIKGDRLRARMEIEKLILYMGAGSPDAAAKLQHKTVTLADAQNSCGEAGIQSIDDLVYAFADRNVQQSLRSLSRLIEEGVMPVTVLRSLQNHLLKLHGVKTMMELHGQPLDIAMKSLQPPIFFKQADQFTAQLRKYSLPQLRSMLKEINELEARTKQSGVPVDTLLGQFLLKSAA